MHLFLVALLQVGHNTTPPDHGVVQAHPVQSKRDGGSRITMETCVLIPTELSLVLTAGPSTLLRGRVNEMGVRVWSNQRIPRGSKFYPLQGTLRLDKLEVYSKLDPTDIRHRFGCYDEISVDEPQGTRHCNWIRFLRAIPTLTAEVNLLGSKVDGQVVFETTRSISPHTELVAYCIDDVSANYEDVTVQVALRIANFHFRQAMGLLLEESPLDLSTTLVSSRILITSASELEETKNFPDPSYPYSITLPQRRMPRERTLLPCEVCGKTFDRPSLLKRHMLTHTGEKPHSCDICGKGFSTSSSLNTHRRIHSGEKPHQCTVCGKRFTASSNLYYHRMTHIKDKPHKCTLCSKSFSTPGDLKNHMYIHSGSWPLKCHICNRGFSRQTNLKNHLFLHSGDKPHECELCNKRFAQAGNLRTHLRTHAEITNSDDCLVCGQNLSSTNQSLLHGCCEGCYHKQIASRLSGSKDSHGKNDIDSKRIPTTFRVDSEQDGGSSSSEMAFDFPDTPSLSSPSKTSTSSDDGLFASATVDVNPLSTAAS